MPTVSLNKLYSSIGLSILKRLFLRQKFKYFLQVNELYLLSNSSDDEYKELSVSAKVSYKKIKQDEEVKYTVKFIKTSSIIDKKLVDLEDQLQSFLGGEVISKVNTIKYVEYVVLTARQSEYFDLGAPLKRKTRESIQISRYSPNWRLDNHMLITGPSGSGKTYLMFSILRKLQAANAFIVVCDNKFDELEIKAKEFGIERISHSIEQSVKYIELVSKEVDKRYQTKQQELIPVVLVCDELAAMRMALDKKAYADVEKNLRNIILKGRRCKVIVCLAQQYQSSSAGLPLDMVSSIHYKILLGNNVQNFKNLFETSTKTDLLTKDIGQGYYNLNGGEVKSFYAPTIIE